MNWFKTLLLLLVVYLVVFVEATFNGLRHFIGAQVDLLPSLVVYASLSGGVIPLALVAVCGGLWHDSLSANPLGISVLPLFLIGFVIERYRGLILREQTYAQWVIGALSSAAAPLMTLVILFNLDQQPLIGWFSLWQWLVMTLAGAAMTPIWFVLFDWITRTLTYRPLGEMTFRADREIKRGR